METCGGSTESATSLADLPRLSRKLMPTTTVHHRWLITIFSSSSLAYYSRLQFIIIGLLWSSFHQHWLIMIFFSSSSLAYYNLLQFPPLQIPSVCLISFNPILQPDSYNPHLTPVQMVKNWCLTLAHLVGTVYLKRFATRVLLPL